MQIQFVMVLIVLLRLLRDFGDDVIYGISSALIRVVHIFLVYGQPEEVEQWFVRFPG